MRKEKRPETLSNSRDKRTVGQQTKKPAEVTKEGPARPLGGTRRTEPAGRGGGSSAAPGPLSRLLGAPHFTPRRPRPRLCGAGNTPAAQTAPAPSLPPPRLPAAARPARSRQDPPRSPGPSSARVSTAGGGSPNPGARRIGPGACRWDSEGLPLQGPRSNGYIGVPGADSGPTEGQSLAGKVEGLGGTGLGAVSRDREEGGRQDPERGVHLRGPGLAVRAGGVCAAREAEPGRQEAKGVAVRWEGQPAEKDNEIDGKQKGSAPPRPRADPDRSYLFKRRLPPAPPRSRGPTRRVVSEPPVVGDGSISPRPPTV